jgi:hypothetical protein
MLAPGEGRRRRQNRRLARWPRWAHAWLDDRQRHAAALAEAGARAPIRPGERLLAVACGTVGDVVAASALTELRALTGLEDAAGSGLGGRLPGPFHHRS